MKSKSFITCAGVGAVTVCLTGQTLFAGVSAELNQIKKELRAATPVEMPAKAAHLVSQCKSETRNTTAENVVSAAFIVRPVAVVAVVGAIARDNPGTAPVAAAQAASLQPKKAAIIARAAASAAPLESSNIVYAVCKVVPTEFSKVVVGVTQAVPAADRQQIWAAVTAAVPVTKTTITTTPDSGRPTTFAALPPPVEGPPYFPAGSPTTLTQTNAVEVSPGGGRDYSGP